MKPKLRSYLRTHRMKSGLTQRDVTSVLPIKSGSTLSKIEKGHRTPSVHTLLSYCIIFDIEPYDAVPGLMIDIEDAVLNRAPLLIEKLKAQKESQTIKTRIDYLSKLCERLQETRSEEVCTMQKETKKTIN